MSEPLAPEFCRTSVTCDGVPESARAGSTFEVAVTVRNDGQVPLTSTPPHPVSLTHRWTLLDGATIASEARVLLEEPLAPGAQATLTLSAQVPDRRGPSYLRVSLVQEGVCFFDDVDPRNGFRATVYATR